MDKRAVVIAIGAFQFCPLSVFGAPSIDQQHVPVYVGGSISYSTIGANNWVDWSQTFTVGTSGRLIGFDVWVNQSSDSTSKSLLFDIRSTSNGVPTEPDFGPNILSSGEVPASSIPFYEPPLFPKWVHVDLINSVPVNIGDVLALVLRSDAEIQETYNWMTDIDGTYEHGSAFVRATQLPVEQWRIRSTIDSGFRTYVLPIPEPPIASLLYVTVSAGMCCIRRRRALPLISNSARRPAQIPLQ